MNIIEKLANENGGYSNMQTWDATYPVPDGYAVWTDTLDDANFYAYNGFVTLTVEKVNGVDTVTAYEPDVEAWEAWKASLPDPTAEQAAQAREKRDRLLAESDWTQVLDAPISAECREEFRVYRQKLRDITEQEGFPLEIVWPEMPAIVKAEPDPVDTAVDVLLGGEA